MHSGTVKYWNSSRGYGILRRSDGAELFAHVSALVDEELDELAIGAAVKFDTRESKRRPGQPEAQNVILAGNEGNH